MAPRLRTFRCIPHTPPGPETRMLRTTGNAMRSTTDGRVRWSCIGWQHAGSCRADELLSLLRVHARTPAVSCTGGLTASM
jgi:hypothetical protein